MGTKPAVRNKDCDPNKREDLYVFDTAKFYNHF